MKALYKIAGVALLGLVLCGTAQAMTTYGPTKKGDTTWQVAKHFHIKGVSMDHMIDAIEQLNPGAFGGADGVTLALGQTLRIPTTRDEVKQALHPAAATQSTPATTAAETPSVSSTPTTATVTNTAPSPATSGAGMSIWAWIWFVLFIIALALYLRSRWLVKKLRMTHHIVTHRLGMGRRSDPTPKEVSRYSTMGMKPRDTSKLTGGTDEAKIIGEVMNDMAAQHYDVAEKKLLNAIRQNKMDLDLRMKLLDVYVATNDQNAFSKQAEYLLKHMISENDPRWARVRNIYLKKWVYDE